MYCPVCGTKCDLNFCPNCGVDLKEVRRKMEENIQPTNPPLPEHPPQGFSQMAATNNMCVICGQNHPKKKFKDGGVCKSCLTFSRLYKPKTALEVREGVNCVARSNQLGAIFQTTRGIKDEILFDDSHKILYIKRCNYYFPYSNIIGYCILERFETAIQGGGVGRAIIGGALFGGAGAVVGAMTGKKEMVSYTIRTGVEVFMNDPMYPKVYLIKFKLLDQIDQIVAGLSYAQSLA